MRRAEHGRRHLVGKRRERVGDDANGDLVVVPDRVRRDGDVLEHERARALVAACGPARRHHDRRVVLVDEERAGCRLPQLVPAADPGRHRTVAEVGGPRGAGRRGTCREGDLRLFGAERDETQSSDVDRRPGVEARPVQTLVLALEPLDEIGERRGIDLTGEVQGDAPALAAVAQVGRPLPLHRVPPHLVVEATKLLDVRVPRVDPAEPDVVPLLARGEQAGGGEETCERRNHRRPHAELLSKGCGVHGAGAAVGDENELGGVATLLRRDGAQRAHHRRVRKVVHRASRDAEAVERRTGQRPRDVDLPVGHLSLRDETERDVRVGHGRVVPAEPVARRPGHGPGAPRADADGACLVAPRDRPAARADLGDVDGRDADELARPAQKPRAGRERRADLVLLAAGHAAAFDERGLGSRAAHVERDRVLVTKRPGQRQRSDDARRRPRLQRVDGPHRSIGGGHHPARRLHDRQGAAPQAAMEVAHVLRHEGTDVGVDDCSRRPLVLLLLAEDLGRERHGDARKLVAQDLAETPLVLRVEVRVQQAHGNGLDRRVPKPGRDRARLRLAEGSLDRAVREHPLADLEAEMPFDERPRLRPERVVEMRHAHTPELENVAKARRRHECRSRPAVLEHRVGCNRRTVHDLVRSAECLHRRDDGGVVRRRCRQDLGEPHASVVGADNNVRERPADVGADPRHSVSDGSSSQMRSTAHCIDS